MLLEFFGRLHPLVVHLPIGILVLAFVFEALSFYEKHSRLRRAVRPSLFIGFLSAVFACITGLVLKGEGGYDADRLEIHQYLGLATAAMTLIVLYLRKFLKTYYTEPKRRKLARIFMLFGLIIILSVTGHYGGTLTHGDEYLSFNLTSAPEQPKELSTILSTVQNHDTLFFYQDVIHPLLAARCFSCHSATKQKGDLRLDRPEFILKGGKEGKIFTAGLADSSSLYTRLLLPLDDDHHMPPSEKPQLTSTDIALVQEWIQSGAKFDQRIESLSNKDRIRKFLASYSAASENVSWVPTEDIDAADADAVETLKKAGLVILPVNHDSHYLMVNFTNAREFQDEWTDGLKAISRNIVWIDLSNTTITQKQLQLLPFFENLRVLYLNHASITDQALGELNEINSLVQLSLVGTQVTDSGLSQLKTLEHLRKVFLFGTRVTSTGFKTLKANHPGIVIDSGNYKLEKLPTDTLIFKRKS